MSTFLGPLDAAGRVPPRQQTRVGAFLVSCHGAMARQLAVALAWQTNAAWQAELNTQFYRESEFVSLLLRATSWIPDPELMFLLPSWEAAARLDTNVDVDLYCPNKTRPAKPFRSVGI